MTKTLKKSDMGRVLSRMTHGCLGHIKLRRNNDVMLLCIDVASEPALTPADYTVRCVQCNVFMKISYVSRTQNFCSKASFSTCKRGLGMRYDYLTIIHLIT